MDIKSFLKAVMKWLEKEFSSRLKSGDKVQVLDSPNKTGTVSSVTRNGFGYYEGYMSCKVTFPNGSSHVYYENELKLI